MIFEKALTFAVILIFYNVQSISANTFTTAINKFSNQFYKVVTDSKPSDNNILSGLSCSTALSFLSLGTRGDTQNELITVLGLQSQSAIESAFKPAITNINNVQGITLNIANKAYVQDFPSLDLNSVFKQKAVDIFRADVEKINFADNVQATKTINTWIENKTNDKIKNMLSSDSVNGNTRVVLVNALYFKGLWETPFNKTDTRSENFNVNSNTIVKVDMMQRLGKFGLLNKEEWKATIIELPYQKLQASMVIILPDEIDGLSEVEKSVAASGNLKQDIFDGISERKIYFGMPRFKIETKMDLKDLLPKMGIKSIFDPSRADLTGILNNSESLYVSTAFQRAFVEVNEEGTESAVATVIGASTTSAPPSFTCNKPFMFLIKLATGEILFSGRFTGKGGVIQTTQPGTGTSPPNGNITQNEYNIRRIICLRTHPKFRPKFCEELFPPKSTYPLTKKCGTEIPMKKVVPPPFKQTAVAQANCAVN